MNEIKTELDADSASGGVARYRPWWYRYSNTLIFFVGFSSYAIYLVLACWLNPVPKPDQLVRVPIKVLSVRDRDPHLQVQLADGSRRMMEFPVTVSLGSRRYYWMAEADKKKLPGCNGYAEGVNMQLVFGDRFRVWAMQCGDVKFTFENSRGNFLKTTRSDKPIYWSYSVFIFLTTAIFFWAERRNYKRTMR